MTAMKRTPGSVLALLAVVTAALAQFNGMDSSMDMPMSLAVGNMLPYVHFTPGDNVWFVGWVPRSTGAMVGTCVGVFLLSMLERWLAGCIGLAERHWAERTDTLDIVSPPADPSGPTTPSYKWYRMPPFVPGFEIARGAMFGAHTFLKVFLMMIVMTFQLAFIASIVVGSGVGETLFGRFSLSSHEH